MFLPRRRNVEFSAEKPASVRQRCAKTRLAHCETVASVCVWCRGLRACGGGFVIFPRSLECDTTRGNHCARQTTKNTTKKKQKKTGETTTKNRTSTIAHNHCTAWSSVGGNFHGVAGELSGGDCCRCKSLPELGLSNSGHLTHSHSH